MKRQECEQLTLFQEDSPASRSALPGSEEARRMTVTSGLKCLELYRNSGLLGLLVRMLLESSLWRSTRCWLTWKTKVTPSKRLLFRLVPSTPRTGETDARLSGVERWKENITGEDGEPILWKTPIASDSANREFYHNSRGEPNLSGMVKMWPTPKASDCKGSGPAGTKSAVHDLKAQPERRCDVLSDTDNGCRTLRRDGELPAVEETGESRTDHGGGAQKYVSGQWWPTEPNVGRVAHGIPARVDRLKCLGNAVVPQQFYPIFQAIADTERRIIHG